MGTICVGLLLKTALEMDGDEDDRDLADSAGI